MRKIEYLLDRYAESHQTAFNIKIHYYCVPAIFFSLLGILYWIPFYKLFIPMLDISIAKHINLATALIIFGTLYYLTLSAKLAISMLAFSILALILIHVIELNSKIPLWLIMLVIFVIAWFGQFIGHKHEGKKPSFLEDIQFLMIGPAWTLSHLYKRLGIKL